MTFKDFALHMYPYWLTGVGVLFATCLAGKKEMIRIEKKAVFDWIKFLAIVTIYRIAIFMLFPHLTVIHEAAKTIAKIPAAATLTVFWEDAMHGLPLLMLRNLLGEKKWTKPIYFIFLALVMLEFASGHVYQGVFAAALLSLYIPYSIKLGEKYGFGTVMVCHTLFDFTTILSMKMLLGA